MPVLAWFPENHIEIVWSVPARIDRRLIGSPRPAEEDQAPRVLRARIRSTAEKNDLVRVACMPGRKVEIDGRWRYVDFRIEDGGECPVQNAENPLRGTVRKRVASLSGLDCTVASAASGIATS